MGEKRIGSKILYKISQYLNVAVADFFADAERFLDCNGELRSDTEDMLKFIREIQDPEKKNKTILEYLNMKRGDILIH